MNRSGKIKIYTRQGDGGKTRLFGGRIVPKDNTRIEICGTLDELNSVLGLVLGMPSNGRMKKILRQLQNDIFLISAELAAPLAQGKKGFRVRFREQDILHLENVIDELDERLPLLENFILPGGTSTAAWLHLARTVCRRAERRLVTLQRREKTDPGIQIYLNRLSDLLFVLARYANQQQGKKDITWKNLKRR
jgi:cob(I)alamin adenosyltransferase